MAELIKLKDLRGGYVDLVGFVRDNGRPSNPRGMAVREILSCTVEVEDPEQCVPWDVGRKMNPDIFAAETAHLIGGVSDLQQMVSVSHVFGNFANGPKLLGAYGPRTYAQIPHVLRTIVSDPDTRQGVATIWSSTELFSDGNKDMPCTVALTFALRDGRLNMHTFMRSNDVFLGVTYDYGMFSRLQISMAFALGVGVGTYTHTAANLHLYERDVEKTHALHQPVSNEVPADLPFAPVPRVWDAQDTPLELDEVAARWSWVRENMERAVLGDDLSLPVVSEARWYADRLRRHVSGNALDSVLRYVLPGGFRG